VEVSSGRLILLVTTRGRGHWTIPKGWPKAKLSEAAQAAREAYEEAGVEGEIGETPVGTFDYVKRLHFFAWIRCRVTVYPLQVDRQLIDWPERASRKLVWAAPLEAASLVKASQLKALLRAFGDAPRNDT
jgi:ADP-ribose pyrophosphatase YjhB (NUDIX family)